jgi:hypothetical protein
MQLLLLEAGQSCYYVLQANERMHIVNLPNVFLFLLWICAKWENP